MADNSKGIINKSTMKAKMEGDLAQVTGTADLLTGNKELGGRLGKGTYPYKQNTKTADFDNFLTELEKGLTNITIKKGDVPFGGVLGNVDITRETKGKTTNK
jgi:hypothetical protein